jgi:hypothetical protein
VAGGEIRLTDDFRDLLVALLDNLTIEEHAAL